MNPICNVIMNRIELKNGSNRKQVSLGPVLRVGSGSGGWENTTGGDDILILY